MVFLYFYNFGFDFAYFGFYIVSVFLYIIHIGFDFKLTIWNICGS